MAFAIAESVDVTKVLKDIIQAYPYGPGLLRELLQNSDDAGSTYQTFILDKRSFGTSTLYDPALAKHQGPALIACNDSVFKPADWKAITQLYESSKSSDQTKAGKFGIGFRASYHLTDCPAILSADQLCVLNPHATLAPIHPRGFSLPFSEWLHYSDQLKPFQPAEEPFKVPYEGTAIRLPLRTVEQASHSRIKQEPITVDIVEELFNQYLALELDVALLYLRHVRRITFIVKETDGSCRTVGQVEVQNAVGLGDQRNVTGVDDLGVRKFTLDIRTERGQQVGLQRWHMLHYIEGTDTATQMVEEIFLHPVKTRLQDEKLYPHVALAMPEQPLGAGQGKLFTVLPLPLATNFPLHVHAMLAITPDRQHLRNATEHTIPNSRDNLLVCWNRTILNKILPKAWRQLFLWLKLAGEKFYTAFPPSLPANAGEVWIGLFAALCTLLSQDPVWPDNRNAFVKLEQALICASTHEHVNKLNPILADLQISLTALPSTVYNSLFGVRGSASSVLKARVHSSAVLAARVKEHPLNIPALSSANKVYLLNLITESGESLEHSIGLPLWPVMSGDFVPLCAASSKAAVLFVTRDAAALKVFLQWQSTIMDTSILPAAITDTLYECTTGNDTGCNLVRLPASQLPAYLAEYCSGSGSTGPVKASQAMLEWCCHLWTWLFSITHLDRLLSYHQVSGYAIVPDSKGFLHTLPGMFLPATGFSSALRTLLEKLSIRFLAPDLNTRQLKVWKSIIDNDQRLGSILANIPETVPELSLQDCKLLREFVLQNAPSMRNPTGEAVRALKQLPIWPVLHHGCVEPPRIVLAPLTGTVHWCARDVHHIPVLPVGVKLVMCDQTYRTRDALFSMVNAASQKPLSKEGVLILALQHWSLQNETETLLSEIINSMHGLFTQYPAAKALLRDIPVICVTGSIKLACLSEIVLPGSPVQGLYLETEYVVPTSEEMQKTRWKQFLAFDLIPRALSPQLASGRLSTYQAFREQQCDSEELSRKVVHLLKLIDDCLTQGAERAFLEPAIIDRLQHELQATSTGLTGHVTGRCRDQQKSILFDLVLPVIPYTVRNAELRKALHWDTEVSFKTLCAQLQEATNQSATDPLRNSRVVAIIKALASRSLSAAEEQAMETLLEDRAWVPTESGDLTVAKCALRKPADLQPAFFTVSLELGSEEGTALLTKLGIMEAPSLQMLLNWLHGQQGKTLSALELTCAGKVLGYIADHPRVEYYDVLVVPSKEKMLKPVAEALIPDLTTVDVSLPENTFLVSDLITLTLARKLGIRSAREAIFADNFFENGQCEDWTQKQAPASQISKLLSEQYSLDQMVYEVIANAEDAQANTLNLFLDERHHKSNEYLISPEWEDQTGPALLIYNNATFTETDWEGFKAMGQGSKRSLAEPTVGRFGLGALSMYHIADTITVLSGEHIAFFDPLCQRLPQIKGHALRSGGLRFPLLKDAAFRLGGHLSHLKGLFKYDPSKPFPGTIFRLPLRQKPSGLSPAVRSAFDLRSLLRSFQEKARSCFLFTNHIRRLEALSRYDGSTDESMWTVECNKTQDLGLDRKIAGGSAHHERVVVNIRGDSENWSIYKLRIPTNVIPGVDHRRLGLGCEVSVGIAIRSYLERPESIKASSAGPDTVSSSLFATLPLPIGCSLPFLLHGDFILSQDRSAIRLHSDDCPDQAEYNKHLLQEVLPALLLHAIANSQDARADKSRYYTKSLWPTGANSTVEKVLVHGLYNRQLVDTNEAVIPDHKGRLIQPSAAVFLRQTRAHISRQILLAAGIDGICNSIPFPPQMLSDDQWRELQTDTIPCLIAAMKGNPTGLVQSFKSKKLDLASLAAVLALILSDPDLTTHHLKALKVIPVASGDLAVVPLEGEVPLYYANVGDMRILQTIASRRLVAPDYIKHLAMERLVVGQGSMKRIAINPIDKAAIEGLVNIAIPKALQVAKAACAVNNEWLDEFWSKCANEHHLSAAADKLRELPLLPARRPFDGTELMVSSNACSTLPIIESNVPAIIRQSVFELPHIVVLYSNQIHNAIEPFSSRQLLDAIGRLPSAEQLQIFASAAFPSVAGYLRNEFEREHQAVLQTGRHVEQLKDLPIWPSTKRGKVSAGSLLQSTAFTLLPVGMTCTQAYSFLSDTPEYIDADSRIRYHALIALGLQPLSLHNVLNQLARRAAISAEDLEAYLRLVIDLVRHHGNEKSVLNAYSWIPNGEGQLRKPAALYSDCPLRPFISAMYTQRSTAFPHPGLRVIRATLVRHGLRDDPTRELPGCLTVFSDDVIDVIARNEQGLHGRRIAETSAQLCEVISRLPNSISLQQLRDLHIVPCQPSDRTTHWGTKHFKFATTIVARIRDVLFPEFEAVAWTRRPLAQADAALSLKRKYPSLGVPDYGEVVHHLQVLVCEVFPAHGASLKLLADLKATYTFLQDRLMDNKARLAPLRNLKVFLNVDDASNMQQSWHFLCAKDLAIGQEYDFPEKDVYAVRNSLRNYQDLLEAAGTAKINWHTEIERASVDNHSTQAGQRMLKFNEMRHGEGVLTDMAFELQDSETTWKVHKLVLHTASPFFESMFDGAWLEATQSKPILIHHEHRDLTEAAVDAILLYIYTGTLPQYKHQTEPDKATDLAELLLDILTLSSYWQLDTLKDHVEAELASRRLGRVGLLRPDSAVDILACAKVCDATQLISKCDELIQKNPEFARV